MEKLENSKDSKLEKEHGVQNNINQSISKSKKFGLKENEEVYINDREKEYALYDDKYVEKVAMRHKKLLDAIGKL